MRIEVTAVNSHHEETRSLRNAME